MNLRTDRIITTSYVDNTIEKEYMVEKMVTFNTGGIWITVFWFAAASGYVGIGQRRFNPGDGKKARAFAIDTIKSHMADNDT